MHPADQKIHDDIAKFGWHVMRVLGEPQYFGYTIGIHQTFGKPELFIAGLDLDGIHAFCNQYGEDVCSGVEYKAGDDAIDWCANPNVKMTFVEVLDEYKPYFLGKLVDAMNDSTIPVLQAVWSDENGLLPWDKGFDTKLEGIQFFLNSPSEP